MNPICFLDVSAALHDHYSGSFIGFFGRLDFFYYCGVFCFWFLRFLGDPREESWEVLMRFFIVVL